MPGEFEFEVVMVLLAWSYVQQADTLPLSPVRLLELVASARYLCEHDPQLVELALMTLYDRDILKPADTLVYGQTRRERART